MGWINDKDLESDPRSPEERSNAFGDWTIEADGTRYNFSVIKSKQGLRCLARGYLTESEGWIGAEYFPIEGTARLDNGPEDFRLATRALEYVESEVGIPDGAREIAKTFSEALMDLE